MARITLLRGGVPIACREGMQEAHWLYEGEYRPGDALRFESDTPRAVVSVDAAVAPARVYLPACSFVYPLPLSGDLPLVYAPGAFRGERHLLSIAPDPSNEYRNLAVNPADLRGAAEAFPHAEANVETRGESQFFARNAIDGLRIACRHGHWPYQSWGVGTRADAEITLRFGRPVRVDRMALYLRADFPHDAYWTRGTATLSDGFRTTFPLEGIDGRQEVALGWHTVEWIRLSDWIKCDLPSPFPALRQWEVYGMDA